MENNVTYTTFDGRNETTEFHNAVRDAVRNLKPGEGLHIIKEFEPFPLYDLMEKHGLDRHVEKKGEEEYHAWFFPKSDAGAPQMKKHLSLDNERIRKMLDIKLKLFRNEITPEEARSIVNDTFDTISAEEFAYGEQHLLDYGINDEAMAENMNTVLEVFQDVLKKNELDLPKGHPIRTYIAETDALKQLLVDMEQQLHAPFVKNKWLAFYEKLRQINIHFSRKQHQLFSLLEQKGFDRPSRIMWTFDNAVRDAIKDARNLLEADDEQAFIEAQPNVIYLVRDILEKELEVLYPASLKLVSDEEFARMRISDDEIGYCLVEQPPAFLPEMPMTPQQGDETHSSHDLLSDLAAVLAKHGVRGPGTDSDVLDVSMGKLTLKQINLIFKHLPIDLSYVDEQELVKFYSDTKHRVFPRSAGVIGRKVQNCHPRESVETVEAIIDAFRKGEQDKAEFWIEMNGTFIYIIYTAVREEDGTFRGVLEMMQDATHIRSLTGSRTLLTWDEEFKTTLPTIETDEPIEEQEQHHAEIHAGTIIAPLLKKYPYLKDFLISLNPKYGQLNNPVMFKTMGNLASLDMVAQRGGFEVDELVAKLKEEISRHSD
ncbi:histidine kinase [candidate division KSB3 bacterium]|uniref:Histidine kinase n=1 Tax=candidate division KSB3 bacterium TaxID=2044937 RepID=A0A2G6EAU9_9BACT|nr:MAG: histidine kinase [candidate division KSB3 bacterium]